MPHTYAALTVQLATHMPSSALTCPAGLAPVGCVLKWQNPSTSSPIALRSARCANTTTSALLKGHAAAARNTSNDLSTYASWQCSSTAVHCAYSYTSYQTQKQGPAWPTLGSAAAATAAVVVPSLQHNNRLQAHNTFTYVGHSSCSSCGRSCMREAHFL